MKWYAGVDGGGTKTTLLCRSVDGSESFCREFGPFNITSIGADNFRVLIKNITDTIAGLGECEGLCIGAAGYSSQLLHDEVEAGMANAGIKKWALLRDSQIALAGALEGRDGIALIAGTGSICIGKAKDQFFSVGGWGHIIGDEGSGYALGREGIAAAAKAIDGCGEQTALVAALKERFGLSDRKEIISYVYGGDKSCVAAAARLVLEAAGKGDAVAMRIIERNVEELVSLISAVYRKMECEETELALMGGLLSNPTALRKALVERLAVSLPGIAVVQNAKSAVEGALLLASQL